MFTVFNMMVDGIKKSLLNLTAGAFGVVWIGIMVSAAATIPIVGFIVAVPAALVAYSVHAALTGASRDRIEILSA